MDDENRCFLLVDTLSEGQVNIFNTDELARQAVPVSLFENGGKHAVLSATSGEEWSYTHPQVPISLFTYYLVEALHGFGKQNHEPERVTAHDIIQHVMEGLQQAHQSSGQHPQAIDYNPDFPIKRLGGEEKLERIESPSKDILLNDIKTKWLVGEGLQPRPSQKTTTFNGPNDIMDPEDEEDSRLGSKFAVFKDE